MKTFKLTKLLFSISTLSFLLAGCNLLPKMDLPNNSQNQGQSQDQTGKDDPTPVDPTIDPDPSEPQTPTEYDDDTVLANPNEDFSYHAVGGYEGTWMANDDNKMFACSINQVKSYDEDLGNTLKSKSLQYLYFSKIYVDDVAEWIAYAVVDNERVEYNGGHAFKCIECIYSEEDELYVINSWLPDPAYGGVKNVEALTDNIYMPPYQEQSDEYGMNWSNNPVLTSENGDYLFVMAKYTYESTDTKAGWGFGMVKI